MALIAPILIGIVLFLWFAFMFTIWACFMAIIALCQAKFFKASVWLCTGIFMLVWWDGKYGWEIGLPLYTIVIGAGALFAGWKHSKGVPIRPVPTWTSPTDTSNIIPFVKATREEREKVMVIQGHLCANPYCNTDLRQSIPHWDHITPRNKGGTDSIHNMQWLCDTCNLNKRDMEWLEFLYRYATNLGIDPNVNQKPWQKWVLTRTENGLRC
jgi:hypothetical protein